MRIIVYTRDDNKTMLVKNVLKSAKTAKVTAPKLISPIFKSSMF